MTTRGQRTLKDIGVFPFAPARLMRTAGWTNFLLSQIAGRDIENGFQPGAPTGDLTNAQYLAGDRQDIVGLWGRTDLNVGQKAASTFRGWVGHAQGIFSQQGFRRSLAPALVGEVAFQGAKALKANQVIPPAMRRFVRFY